MKREARGILMKQIAHDVPIKAISKVVSETLSKDFDNLKITNVEVLRDVDFDGDPILKIEITFVGTRRDIDARKISGAVRHVRPKLSAIGELAFPMLSFITQSDAGLGSFEPA